MTDTSTFSSARTTRTPPATARTTRRAAALTAALVLGAVAVASAHDMFAKPERFLVAEGAEVLVRVLNGTFSKSENAIARDRVRTAGAGTYVIGVSTRPRIIALEAKDFNLYLREDGIPDVLAARRAEGELEKPARERYATHVKALIQVGATRSDDFGAALGYPAELVPLENPYALRVGGTLRVRTLVDGQPAANQYVLFGGRTPSGAPIAQRNVRSDAEGVARIPLGGRGVWYVKFIDMARLQGDPEADYESKWATLTFEVR